MSRMLAEALASGKVKVRNTGAGELHIYVPKVDQEPGQRKLVAIRIGAQREADLTAEATVAELMKSPNLKSLASKGLLEVL